MQSPWQRLELDPHAASEKDVKVAYARLIKIHRPDTDPVGFQEVREAYEMALSILRSTPPPPTPEEPVEAVKEPEVAPAPPPEPAMPPALADAQAAVERAKESQDLNQLGRAIGSLYPVCQSIAPGVAGIRLWQQSLHRLTEGRSDYVALGVSVPQLIHELAAGSSVITHAACGCWEATRDLASLDRLAEAMLIEPQRLQSADAAVVALRIALEIAFINRPLAQRLVDLAFPQLDREARERFIPQVERQSALGSLFERMREDQRHFWHQRFRRPSSPWTWDDPAAEAAAAYLAQAQPREWEGFAAIAEIAPAAWMRRLTGAQREQRPPELARSLREADARDEPAPAMSPPRSGDSAPRSIWPLVAAACIVMIPLSLGAAWFWTQRQTAARKAGPAWAEIVPTESPRVMVGMRATEPVAGAKPSAPAHRFIEGKAIAQARASKLRESLPAAATWVRLLTGMHEQLQREPADARRAAMETKDQKFREEVQKVFEGIAQTESNSEVEPAVLEVLLLAPDVPALLKQEAIWRQQRQMMPGQFIASWRMAADESPEAAAMMAQAATWFLANKGHGIGVSSEEREQLELMAHPAETMKTTAGR